MVLHKPQADSVKSQTNIVGINYGLRRRDRRSGDHSPCRRVKLNDFVRAVVRKSIQPSRVGEDVGLRIRAIG